MLLLLLQQLLHCRLLATKLVGIVRIHKLITTGESTVLLLLLWKSDHSG